MLNITVRDVAGITVLDLSGHLVMGLGLESLSQRVRQLVAEKRLTILLNAKEVSIIDSSGVGELVASFSAVKKNGGTLKLASPTKFVREVLRIARIPTILEIYDTEEAALSSFTQ